MVSGDGCSADCRTAELRALCRTAPVLPLNASVSGTTVGGARGFASQCDPFVATPAAIYSFVPPSAGRLHVELDSADSLELSVYSACADDAAELRCERRRALDLDVTAAPLMVMVRGSDPLVEGPFTLRATFIPAVCGDGQRVGSEVCDDGNQVDGDGCSADCSAVDYAVVCAALPPLALGVTNGTTDGGNEYFDTTGACGAVNGAGRGRSYQFTAPSAGTLSLALTQPDADLIVAAYTGCAKPSEDHYVLCSNFAFPGTSEEARATLAAGQRITVTVQGFTTSDVGGYTLTTTFSP